MIRTIHVFRLVLMLVVAMGLAGGSALANGAGPGTTAVRTANDKLSALLKKKVPAGSPAEKALSQEVTESLRGFLNIDELGKRALSKHWDSISQAQRDEFLALLRQLIEAKYIEGLRANLDYDVRYVDEESKSGGQRLVKTEISATRRGRPYTIAVDYLLRQHGKEWQAFDVITDGVGLVENYRAQFNSIIKKKGFEGLLELMRKKQSKAK